MQRLERLEWRDGLAMTGVWTSGLGRLIAFSFDADDRFIGEREASTADPDALSSLAESVQLQVDGESSRDRAEGDILPLIQLLAD